MRRQIADVDFATFERANLLLVNIKPNHLEPGAEQSPHEGETHVAQSDHGYGCGTFLVFCNQRLNRQTLASLAHWTPPMRNCDAAAGSPIRGEFERTMPNRPGGAKR